LRFLRSIWDGKLIVKGILHPANTLQAAAIGADAIVLTNHGGRQLDGSVSPMEVQEEIRTACKRNLGFFIDGGFRRGTDIAKALALGADAVMIGRPLLYGAAAAGFPGIERALGILGSELERTLGQLSATSISGLEKRHARQVSGQPS
jgi:(S)-mandelate dehydrogenase